MDFFFAIVLLIKMRNRANAWCGNFLSISESPSLQRTGQVLGNHQASNMYVLVLFLFEVCGQNTEPAVRGHQPLPSRVQPRKQEYHSQPKGIFQRHQYILLLIEASFGTFKEIQIQLGALFRSLGPFAEQVNNGTEIIIGNNKSYFLESTY